MAVTRVSVLGSTGSIGRNTLDVIRHFQSGRDFEVIALTGMNNTDLLARQAIEFNAQIAVTANQSQYNELKAALAGTGIEAAAGQEALVEAATRQADWVMAGIVGIAGLEPTRAAIRNGSTIALANKECLVCAGELFLAECKQSGTELLPVDSEHNAIFQVFEERNREGIERIILTASGGPFRIWTTEKMAAATPQIAASHPNWDMGVKISIDSATMFNKALEMIEARHLFAMPPEAIEVVVHPQSVIHSMVGYRDGSVLAQLGCPDMRTAIGYALAWPVRGHVPVERLDFTKLSRLDFESPDESRFPAIRLAREAMQAGGLAGAVLNGAKEAALDAFIEERIGFLDIAKLVERTLENFDYSDYGQSIEAVIDADQRSRLMVHEAMAAV
ncbi:MAG: 1-deoxy-D-xylulose-5-phosphate reductoisomerase [Rhizobiaceae bacterium]